MTSFYLKRFFLIPLLSVFLGSATIGRAQYTSFVRLETTLGPIDIELYSYTKPATAAKFLSYVDNKGLDVPPPYGNPNPASYKNSVIDLLVPGSVLQGGGYSWVEDEDSFDALGVPDPGFRADTGTRIEHARGTIALAVTSAPKSRQFQWVINLADYGVNALGAPPDAYVVFGSVTPASMAVVDAIARLPIPGAPTFLNQAPFVSEIYKDHTIRGNNLVMVNRATSAEDYRGMWWNRNESGWGMTLSQHGNALFAALCSYEDNGTPVWYAMQNCSLEKGTCSSDIYKISGATPPTVPWDNTRIAGTKVGIGTLKFTNASIDGTGQFNPTRGTFSYTINNRAGTKIVERLGLAVDYSNDYDFSDMWWDSGESGWGVSVISTYGPLLATWYTYDSGGKPVWYVSDVCQVFDAPTRGASCFGTNLYQVIGGSPLTTPWNAGGLTIRPVGRVSFVFADELNGVMEYTIDGIASKRKISRLPF